MAEWEEFLTEASVLIENREHYQRRIGELAAKIASVYGPQKLEDFSHTIKETYGLTISVSTLRNYRWVYELTKDLDLPEDLSYRTLQYIASSSDPKMWAEKIKTEGLSSPEALKMLREEKGLIKKEKFVTCPNCGKMFVL